MSLLLSMMTGAAAACGTPSISAREAADGAPTGPLPPIPDGPFVVPSVIPDGGPARDGGDPRADVFRDYTAYTFEDDGAGVWLGQMLLGEDGTALWRRQCPIEPERGPAWGDCTGWLVDAVIELEVAEVSAESFAGGVVLKNDGRSAFAQVVRLTGGTRWARSCAMASKAPDWGDCSPWENVSLDSDLFGAKEAVRFRDESLRMLGDTSAALLQSVLASEGDFVWSRLCSSDPTDPREPPESCPLVEAFPTRSLGLRWASVRALDGYRYGAVGKRVEVQTALSPNGRESASRTCPLGETNGAPSPCAPWSYTALQGILEGKGAL